MSVSSESTCILCSVSFKHHLPKEWEIRWGMNCAESLYQLLDYESLVFRQLLEEAGYCSQCKELIRDIDFMTRSVQSLQRRIAIAKVKVSSLLLSRLSSHISDENKQETPNPEVNEVSFSSSIAEIDEKPTIECTGEYEDTEGAVSPEFLQESETEETNQSRWFRDMECGIDNTSNGKYNCIECNTHFLCNSKLQRHFGSKKHADAKANQTTLLDTTQELGIHKINTNIHRKANSTQNRTNFEEISSKRVRNAKKITINNLSSNEDSLSSALEEFDEDYYPEISMFTLTSDEEMVEIEDESFNPEEENEKTFTHKMFRKTVDFLSKIESSADESKFSYICTKSSCGRRFRNLCKLRKHTNREHEGSIDTSAFQCPFCENKYYANGYGLDLHIIKGHEGDRFCSICSVGSCCMRFYGVNRFIALKSHMALVHGVESYDPRKAFSHMEYRDMNAETPIHKKRKRGVIQSLSCPVEGCGALARTAQTLEFHHKKIHVKDPFPFGCKDCDYRGKTRAYYDKHRAVRHSKKTISCKLCPYTTQHTKNYRDHMKRRHNDQKFPCAVCLHVFLRQEDCLEHEKWHSRATDLTCVLTNCKNKNIFGTLVELQGHVMETHDPSKRPLREVVCDICGAVFKGHRAASILKTHLVTHGDAYFSCRFCERKFKLDALRKRHEEINHQDLLDEGERKVYMCKLCDATFHAQQYLHKHTAWHKHGSNANLPISKKKY